jgi:hypothetical protein
LVPGLGHDRSLLDAGGGRGREPGPQAVAGVPLRVQAGGFGRTLHDSGDVAI